MYTQRRRELNYKARRSIKSRFKYVQVAAKTRGLSFDITFDEYSFLVTDKCFYCGKETIGREMGGGLDRIDNKKGYIAYNVLPCCGWCNHARSNVWSAEEFKVIMDAILKFRREKYGTP